MLFRKEQVASGLVGPLACCRHCLARFIAAIMLQDVDDPYGHS